MRAGTASALTVLCGLENSYSQTRFIFYLLLPRDAWLDFPRAKARHFADSEESDAQVGDSRRAACPTA